MAKIKDFLQQLEDDPQLFREYRGKKTKNERKAVAKTKGDLNDAQADVLLSDDPRRIRQAIEAEGDGVELCFVVMFE